MIFASFDFRGRNYDPFGAYGLFRDRRLALPRIGLGARWRAPALIVPAPKSWIVFGLFLSAAVAAVLLSSTNTAPALLGEAAFVERATAVLYLLSAGAAILAAARTRGLPRLYSCAWLVFSLLCFGEETSWLQHELGYATPRFMADRNVQGEFNIHNLKGLHGGKLLEDDGSQNALGALATVQNLFQLGFLAYFAGLPVLALFGFTRRIVERLRLPVPDLRIAAVIWMPIVVALFWSFTTTGAAKDLAAELREMLYAAAFLQFLALFAASLAPSRTRPPSSQHP